MYSPDSKPRQTDLCGVSTNAERAESGSEELQGLGTFDIETFWSCEKNGKFMCPTEVE